MGTIIGAVTKCPLPDQSRLHHHVGQGDFLDCYCTASALNTREAAQIAMAFPSWVRALLTVRNVLVAPFGLESTANHKNRIGIFPIEWEGDDEIILGFDDTHLDFRISILAVDGMVHFATWVHRKNRFGRFYLTMIMPFHKLIVRSAVRAVARAS